MFGSFSGEGLGFGLAFTLEDRFSNTASEIERSMGKLEQDAEAMQVKVNRSLDTMKLGAGTLAVGLAALTPFMLGLKNASDLQENINKTEVAFGQYADKVKDFANTSLDNFGIDKIRALDMASMFGDMSTGMGFTQEKAYGMSTSLVKLAGDMSSFKNISHDQAQTALSSVFTGDTESLKKLGIVMTQANVDAFLASQGITKSIKDMSQTDQVMARFNFVMNASKNSLGDFYRTQDSYANVKRKFEGAIKETSATLGSILLPIASKIISGLMGIVRVFQEMAESKIGHFILSAIAVMGIFLVVIGAVLLVSGGLKFGMYQLANAFGSQTRAALISTFATKGLAAGFLQMGEVIKTSILSIYGWIAATAIIIGIGLAINKANSAFDEYLQRNQDFINGSKEGPIESMTKWEKLGGIIEFVSQALSSFNGETFKVDENLYNLLDRFGIKDTALAISSYVIRIYSFFQGVIDVFVELKNIVGNALSYIKNKLSDIGIDIDIASSKLETWKQLGIIVANIFVARMIWMAGVTIANFIRMAAAATVNMGAMWGPIISQTLFTTALYIEQIGLMVIRSVVGFATMASSAIVNFAIMSAGAISTGISMAIAFWPITLAIGAIMAIIWALTHQELIEKWISTISDKISSFVTSMVAKGKSMMFNFLQGLKETGKEIIVWVDQFINSIPLIGDLYRGGKMAIGAGVDLFNNVKHSFDTPMQPAMATNQNSFAINKAEARGLRAGYSPVNNFAPQIKYIPPPQTTIIQMDGEEIMRRFEEKQKFNDSRK